MIFRVTIWVALFTFYVEIVMKICYDIEKEW